MIKLIDKVVDILKKGGVILYPTDTVWGLGCDATNAQAVDRLFKIKKRMQDKSVIVLIENEKALNFFVDDIDKRLISFLTDSHEPQTVIFPQVKNLPLGVMNQNGSGAFRIPKNEFCLALLNRFKHPLVSTSANYSGEATPLFFENISVDIKKEVDFVVPVCFEKGATHQPSKIVLIQKDGSTLFLR